MPDSFYDVLGVSPDASKEEMEDAFREKVLETHPDKNDDEDSAEQFKRVKEAKQVLTNPKERQQYDRLGHEAYVKQSGSESLWGIRSSPSSSGTADRTTRQRSSSTASRQSSSRSSSRSADQSTTGGGSRGNERTRKRKRQGGKQNRGQKQEREEQRRGRKRGEQRRRKREGRQRKQEGRQRKKRQRGEKRQRQRQGNQRTKQQQNQRTKQGKKRRKKRRKKQTRSKRERARRQQRGGQQPNERPQQAGGQPGQRKALFPPGLVTVAVSSLGLTAVWLVGRGVVGLLFTFIRAGLSFEVFADTLEFGALAVFSFVLISAFSSTLDADELRLSHYVVIFGTWMLALPVLRVMPFRIDTFATFVFTYAFIGGASIVALATIETIENQS